MGDSMPPLLPVTCVSKARIGGQPKGHSGEGIASYVKLFYCEDEDVAMDLGTFWSGVICRVCLNVGQNVGVGWSFEWLDHSIPSPLGN